MAKGTPVFTDSGGAQWHGAQHCPKGGEAPHISRRIVCLPVALLVLAALGVTWLLWSAATNQVTKRGAERGLRATVPHGVTFTEEMKRTGRFRITFEFDDAEQARAIAARRGVRLLVTVREEAKP